MKVHAAMNTHTQCQSAVQQLVCLDTRDEPGIVNICLTLTSTAEPHEVCSLQVPKHGCMYSACTSSWLSRTRRNSGSRWE